MINEQIAPSTKPATSLPNNRLKTKESLEIAALTAEFLARGGQIKRVKGNQLHVAMNPLAQDIWPEREKVLKIFKEKKIRVSDLAIHLKKQQKLITQWLLGTRTPDNEERVKIEKLVKEWV